MAETDWHRELMTALIATLKSFFAGHPNIYVSGNLLLFYVPGNRRRHVSPDVFVVKGVPRHDRPNYLLWEEGKAPKCVIELTFSSTREEDLDVKFQLYQDVLRVPEYFLFDPLGDYLEPPLQGYRLLQGRYRPIPAFRGRFPSKELGLHLVSQGRELRWYDPRKKQVLPTPTEALAQEQAARQRAEAEAERLRKELDDLRRRLQ
jgi:Uma2 family endonuclease